MLLFALFNQLSATNRQEAIIGAEMVKGCSSFINWCHSDLNLTVLTPSREQSKDYSSNQALRLENVELQPKPDSGRYKTKLVVPR